MTRPRALLAFIILVELATGAVFAYRQWSRPTPPRPDLSAIDPITAADVRALADRCETPADWGNLADAYFATGFLPEAEACYRVAARTGDPEALFRHAFALDRLSLVVEANGRYAAAIDAGHPRPTEVWYHVGRNHLRLEDAVAAADAFAKCGDLPAARLELVRLGRPADLPDAQQSVSLRYRAALARGDARQADELADRFERSPDRLPNPLDREAAWLEAVKDRLGVRAAFKKLPKMPAAEADAFLTDVTANAWSVEAADGYAEHLLNRNRPAEAVKVLADAVDRGGPSVQMVWRLGEAYEAAGRAADARAAWARAAAFGTGPDVKDLRYKLAAAHEQAGDAAAARALLPLAFLSAGIDRHDAGKPAEAVGAFREAVRLDPQLAHGWYRLGEAYRALNRPAEARQAFEKCLSLDPDHGRAARALAVMGK
jgi:tetratricopeptide (TPR) repeat protein